MKFYERYFQIILLFLSFQGKGVKLSREFEICNIFTFVLYDDMPTGIMVENLPSLDFFNNEIMIMFTCC